MLIKSDMTMTSCSILIILCSYVLPCLSDSPVCYTPNKPFGGFYRPKKQTYRVGDVIEFGCDARYFPLSRNASEKPFSTCRHPGMWSPVQDTFCDGPPLKPHIIRLRERREERSNIVEITDGARDTCYHTSYSDRITWQLDLGRMSLISAVRIHGKTDERYRLEVIVQKGSMFGIDQMSCGLKDFTMGTRRSIVYRCPIGTMGDKVFVKDWTRNQQLQTICEIEIFSEKASSSCGPPTNSVPNGYLRYGRNSATLMCISGYKGNTNQDIICENNTWQTNGYFCISDEGRNEESLVLVLSSALGTVFISIILLTGMFLVCIRKRRLRKISESTNKSTSKSFFSNPGHSPVAMKSELRNCRRHESTDDPEDHEYSEVRYSTFLGRVQLPLRVPTYMNDTR